MKADGRDELEFFRHAFIEIETKGAESVGKVPKKW